ELWLIDHGAALYFHHNWPGYLERADSPFPLVRDHTLLPLATALSEADADMRARLSPALFAEIVALAPEAWLAEESIFPDTEAHRRAYVDYLTARLEASARFVEEADRARRALV
ncbi:MAG: aminotransferase class I and II, partial [Caldilineae bacterium]